MTSIYMTSSLKRSTLERIVKLKTLRNGQKFQELVKNGVLVEVSREQVKCLSPTDIIDSQGKKRVVTNFTSLNEEKCTRKIGKNRRDVIRSRNIFLRQGTEEQSI
eukprot:GHVR01154053.1.p2 GENE.GHVR01154053.1~~GHVR01154053.1.p2  ORF type:complete len:105 (+),score=0.52 GHVR01154053.1:508-822(+)